MTLICCPLMVQSADRALADAALAREMGADLVEFRLDEFFTGGSGAHDGGPDLDSEIRAACDLVSRSPAPCIATCRPTWEGGLYDGPDDARMALFEALGTLAPPRGHPPRYIDVELAAYQRSPNLRQKVHLAVDHHPARPGVPLLPRRDLAPDLILSLHDFAGRPADLSRRLLSAREQDACRVLKVAFRARSVRDNLDLFDLLAHRDRPTIALGMGEMGLMSRVLAPKFGALLTFASLRPAEATAPGQPTIRELLDTYRFRSITPRTRVYGVVGWPVGHSLSPLVHNAGFDAVGYDGVYLPLPIAAAPEGTPDAADATYASFKATVLALMQHPALDFAGCSVTLPHKENLARLAHDPSLHATRFTIDDHVRLCDAANTLVRAAPDSSDPRPHWRVMNTDAMAARQALESALGPLGGRRIDVLGAGGVGRTIAVTVAAAGGTVRVLARDPAKAARVVDQIRERLRAAGIPHRPDVIVPAALSSVGAEAVNAVVNATPVGMAAGSAPDQIPLDIARLVAASPRCVVFDTVYNPLHTPLLIAAAAAGLPTIDGLTMFVLQAHAQFRAWTGVDPHEGLFERLARQRLAS